MQKHPEATLCPTSTTSASLETLSFQLCEPTEQINFTIDVQHASRKAAPRGRKSIQAQSLVAWSTEAISNGSASAKHLSDYEISNRQNITHVQTGTGAAFQVNLPPRRHVSVLRSDRHPNKSNKIPNQGKGIDEKHIRKKPRRRSTWVPFDETPFLTIHPSDVGKNLQRKPLAPALKRAPLQPTLKPLQESENQHGS